MSRSVFVVERLTGDDHGNYRNIYGVYATRDAAQVAVSLREAYNASRGITSEDFEITQWGVQP